MKHLSLLGLVTMLLCMSGCNEKEAKLTSVKISRNSEVTSEIKDEATLDKLREIFSDRNRAYRADPTFSYIIDVATEEGKTVRWQYSKHGYCSILSKESRTVFKIKDYETLNRILNVPTE